MDCPKCDGSGSLWQDPRTKTTYKDPIYAPKNAVQINCPDCRGTGKKGGKVEPPRKPGKK